MDGTCIALEGHDKYIQNTFRKPEEKRPLIDIEERLISRWGLKG
jgi:hypothetical protein